MYLDFFLEGVNTREGNGKWCAPQAPSGYALGMVAPESIYKF